MLDMGFIGAVKQIAAAIGPRRQTAMFSATMAPRSPSSPRACSTSRCASRPIGAGARPCRHDRAARDLCRQQGEARRAQRAARRTRRSASVIIFSRTKHGADRVAKNLEHRRPRGRGDPRQQEPECPAGGAQGASPAARCGILVATDIAARGIDVPNITPRHQLRAARRSRELRAPHRPHRPQRRFGLCDHAGATATERAKLRDVERLIRRTLPLENADKIPAGAPSSAPARQPQGRRPAAGHHRPSNPRGAGRSEDRSSGAGQEAAATVLRLPAPRPGKPRWSGKQKTAAKAARIGSVRFGG